MTGVSPVPRISWPRCRELVAQLAEVVDLAVEDRDDVAGLVRDRLAAGREVDHSAGAGGRARSGRSVDRALVGPAVDERGVHPLDQRRVGPAGRARSPQIPHMNVESSPQGGPSCSRPAVPTPVV